MIFLNLALFYLLNGEILLAGRERKGLSKAMALQVHGFFCGVPRQFHSPVDVIEHIFHRHPGGGPQRESRAAGRAAGSAATGVAAAATAAAMAATAAAGKVAMAAAGKVATAATATRAGRLLPPTRQGGGCQRVAQVL